MCRVSGDGLNLISSPPPFPMWPALLLLVSINTRPWNPSAISSPDRSFNTRLSPGFLPQLYPFSLTYITLLNDVFFGRHLYVLYITSSYIFEGFYTFSPPFSGFIIDILSSGLIALGVEREGGKGNNTPW